MAVCGGLFWFDLLILLGVFLVGWVLFVCLLGFFLFLFWSFVTS